MALHQAVQRTIQNSANAIFDLYHYVDDLQAADRLIALDDRVRDLIGRPEFSGRGLLVAGLHTSNFDLCLQWLCRPGDETPGSYDSQSAGRSPPGI